MAYGLRIGPDYTIFSYMFAQQNLIKFINEHVSSSQYWNKIHKYEYKHDQYGLWLPNKFNVRLTQRNIKNKDEFELRRDIDEHPPP